MESHIWLEEEDVSVLSCCPFQGGISSLAGGGMEEETESKTFLHPMTSGRYSENRWRTLDMAGGNGFN